MIAELATLLPQFASNTPDGKVSQAKVSGAVACIPAADMPQARFPNHVLYHQEPIEAIV